MSGSLMNGEIKTIAEQIYMLIRSDILHHELTGGERLTMKFLQERLGVSSSPIREALTRLQQDGLVEYQPNVGMRVTKFSAKDVNDIYAFMRELECAALRFSCQRPEFSAMLHELRELQDCAAATLAQGNLEAWPHLSNKFHEIFYKYADNAYLHDAAGKTRMQVMLFANQYQQEDKNQIVIQQEHENILQLLEKGDIPAAEDALRAHLTASEHKALMTLSAEEN